jgi:hypothetical protein
MLCCIVCALHIMVLCDSCLGVISILLFILSHILIAIYFNVQRTSHTTPNKNKIDDEKAKDDWIGSVGRSIVRCSSTYVSRNQAQGGGGNGGNNNNRNEEEEESDDDYSNSSNNPYFND